MDKEIVSLRGQLVEEKKISARTSAKLNEITSDMSRLENLQSHNNEIHQKMLLKDEEIKKCFANIQSLKNTMNDLEDGIQTYQSMAE